MRFRSAPRRSPKARSRLLPILAAAGAAITASSATPALAADCQATPLLSSCIDADNLWPHASGAFFSMGSALTTPANKSAFALVASYLSRPIGLRVASPDPDGTVIYALDNVVDTTFLWTLGVTNRLELTLALPVTLYQDGGGLADVLGTDDALPRSVVRDGRFGLRFAVLPRSRTGSGDGLALTTGLQFGAPFGAREAFASAGVMTTIPTVAADFRLGRLLFAADLGARIRNSRKLAGATLGSQLTAALGVSVDILPDRWLTASAEAFALYTLASQEPSTQRASAGESASPLIPAEWLASVSSASFLGGDLVLALGGGGFLPTSGGAALTTPRFRINAALRYAPTGRDIDGDGVLDRDDKCVHKAEDRDGFQDDDGCPELDNDNDRIPDDRDRCRDEAETVDGFQDDDGCPDDDDDKDKVPDASDACRNAAEDLDKFEDDD
ncbi:MAG: thrombospondin, partial [Polyangiaceae bacterium]|nr:thrombospondin [Polyangiaceae bacterium]